MEQQQQQQVEEETKDQNNTSMEQQFQDISSFTVEKLLELAEERFEKFEIHDASLFYEEAVKKAPENDTVLLAYGEFLKQSDEIEKAEFVFSRSIELYPTQNLKKYFQLAELNSGQEALNLYEEGVRHLEKDISSLKPEEIKDLCNAYAALAELYQTDFIQFKESEKQCTDNIEKALKLDPSNLDAKLQLANYFLNKEDAEKAKEPLVFIFQNLNLKEDENIMEENNEEQQQTQEEYKKKQLLQDATQSFKINVAKLLMEIELYKQSQAILEHLTYLDSDNKEYLYLLSFVNFKQLNYYQSHEQIEELLGKYFDEDEGLDQEILAAAKELQGELKKVDMKNSKDCVVNSDEQIKQIQDMIQQEGNIEDEEFNEEEWIDDEDNMDEEF